MASQCRTYNGWSLKEETKLVEDLVTMVNSGLYKADNGFKSGYLQYLEKNFKQTFPDSDKSAKNIESKVKTLKKDWQTVYNMINGSNTSGFGWDENNKLLTSSNDVWNDYINVKNNKDKACGNGAKDFADSEKEATIEVLESDEELDTMMEGSHNVARTPTAQVDETTSTEVDKKTKDLKKKRGMITNDIFKMTSLNQQEKYEVMEKIRSDVGYVEAYWDMDVTDRDGWVNMISRIYPIMKKIGSDYDFVELYMDLDVGSSWYSNG
ncbi:myb/SANT-like domain, Harbinger transposase-derived nuclease domain protein [Artemisia annua]|uniref:Myb/SANT-like domain, Harbinger transposase-derived nuclease domain protein n=1 Tax=Artemisia annua TaxID=35608 RepID=A0A2U1P6N3_ARTAN|nr:myb/SANT-like domain, Harbinger transposase-derived nuclease domain protein [Artemisia annua]